MGLTESYGFSEENIPINREQTALGNDIALLIKEIGKCASSIVLGKDTALEEYQSFLREKSGYEQEPYQDKPPKARRRWTPTEGKKPFVHAHQPFAFFELKSNSAISSSIKEQGYEDLISRFINMRRGIETTPFFDEVSPFSLKYMQPIRINAYTQFEMLGHLDSMLAENRASRAIPSRYFNYAHSLFVGLRFNVEKPGQIQVILMQRTQEGNIRSRAFTLGGTIPVVYNDYEQTETAKHNYFYPEDVLVLNFILDAMRRHIFFSSAKIPQPGSSSDG